MPKNALAVFTRESPKWIMDHRCTGNWHLGPDAQKDWNRDYENRGITHVVCCRNADKKRPIKSGDVDDESIESHAAFLVGRITEIKQMHDGPKGEPRHAICLTDFKEVYQPDFWVPHHVRPEFRSIEELDEFGFDNSSFRGSADYGPRQGGCRSSATWEAKHSPIVREIESYLKPLGWSHSPGHPWKPDLLMKDARGCYVLIEVKPSASLHNIITAFGQIMCYRSVFAGKMVSCIIASPAIPNDHITDLLGQFGICSLDLNEDIWKTRLSDMLKG